MESKAPAPYYQPQAVPPPGYYQSSPQPFQVQGAPGKWSSGLCDCCNDVGNCCMTCFCPCVTFGRIAEIVDGGTTSCGLSGALYGLLCSLTGFQCIYSCIYRQKMRGQYNLPASPCIDCCVHCFCESCALCQEYRELKSRGFDPDLGWNGNMQRRTAMGVPPYVPGGMTR